MEYKNTLWKKFSLFNIKGGGAHSNHGDFRGKIPMQSLKAQPLHLSTTKSITTLNNHSLESGIWHNHQFCII
jgi:hypothetical protein